ncbi:alpha-ribazole-5'-phosphate phosphatase [Halalkalibacter wakoensis JCM 9140]|uniref:Alpha-ribazole-5'-phosphate phosphatase n=1 Tax=Halalkalibacter wakoensis JCM 9140 TaxID=1236970 RepID=W4PXS5_9BACI|nr:histidine phosphatase family protein [Halalkalibacter wakoensis]GAE24656.1 alpha-ribazole-5'-phosphate phosphatase [Halalkalibacter wakoensis JCM 9140]
MGTCHHMDLFLVRHGVTTWNKEKRYLGQTDVSVIKSELNELDELKNELKKIEFDGVFSSDLRRCQETLSYLEVPSHSLIDKRLREINFGDWEGKTYEELQHVPIYRQWLDQRESVRIPNGECFESFQSRIDSFINELFKRERPYNNVLVLSHGGVIRYVVSKLLPHVSFWSVSVEHGQAIKLSFIWQEGEWLCNSLSEVPSQEKEKL